MTFSLLLKRSFHNKLQLIYYEVTFHISCSTCALTALIFLISEKEHDSICQKLQRFVPNLLMSLELYSVYKYCSPTLLAVHTRSFSLKTVASCYN